MNNERKSHCIQIDSAPCTRAMRWWCCIHICLASLFPFSFITYFPPRLFVHALRTPIEAHKARAMLTQCTTSHHIHEWVECSIRVTLRRPFPFSNSYSIQIFNFLQNGLTLFARIRHFSLGREATDERWGECVIMMLAQAFEAHVCFIYFVFVVKCSAKHPLSSF